MKKVRQENVNTNDEQMSSFEAQALASKRATLRTMGTVTPVDDFRALIEQDTNAFTDVCQQMSAIVIEFIQNSHGDALFDKAIQCLLALRCSCIEKLEPKLFNDLAILIRNRTQSADGRKDFWKKMIEGNPRGEHGRHVLFVCD
jgi:hypothetical protein